MATLDESILDRAMYKRVKGMNRDDMEQLLKDIYKTGYDAALKEAGTSIDLDALRSDLKLIKGVGENRLNEIMAVIEIHLRKLF